jgi:hypothetical protein
MRQGDNLAPTLFSMFVNDLAHQLKSLNAGINVNDDNVSILLYADDIAVISDSPENMQRLINELHTWSEQWLLHVNLDKTKFIHFRKKAAEITTRNIKFGNITIQKTTQYKYLGIVLDEHLDYTITAKTLADASSRALGSLISKHYSCKGLYHSTYWKIYEATVVPVFNYGAGVWGTKRYDVCDNVQNRAIRTFLGVGKRTPLPVLYGDTGCTPVYIRHKLEVLSLWFRLCRLPRDRLTRRIFEWDYQQACAGHNSWCKDVLQIMTSTDMEHLFWSQNSPRYIKPIVQTIQNKLIKNHDDNWIILVQSMPKLRTYKTFKTTPGKESYLDLPPKHRKALARFRAGVFPLEIERGRWRGRPVETRLCTQCHMNAVEDENHYLMDCPKYSDIRKILFDNITSSNSDALPTSFSSILRDNSLQQYIANFITDAYAIRNYINC